MVGLWVIILCLCFWLILIFFRNLKIFVIFFIESLLILVCFWIFLIWMLFFFKNFLILVCVLDDSLGCLSCFINFVFCEFCLVFKGFWVLVISVLIKIKGGVFFCFLNNSICGDVVLNSCRRMKVFFKVVILNFIFVLDFLCFC